MRCIGAPRGDPAEGNLWRRDQRFSVSASYRTHGSFHTRLPGIRDADPGPDGSHNIPRLLPDTVFPRDGSFRSECLYVSLPA